MLTSKQLEEMSQTEIDKIDKNTLVDIQSVKIDTSLPAAERMRNYLAQIKNPYCFKCGDTPVKICFKDDGKELKNVLENYFLRLKNSKNG